MFPRIQSDRLHRIRDEIGERVDIVILAHAVTIVAAAQMRSTSAIASAGGSARVAVTVGAGSVRHTSPTAVGTRQISAGQRSNVSALVVTSIA